MREFDPHIVDRPTSRNRRELVDIDVTARIDAQIRHCQQLGHDPDEACSLFFEERTTRLRIHPAKPKVGIRASRPNEVWHIDTTIIRLLDGTIRVGSSGGLVVLFSM
jgi:hypothetical protein